MFDHDEDESKYKHESHLAIAFLLTAGHLYGNFKTSRLGSNEFKSAFNTIAGQIRSKVPRYMNSITPQVIISALEKWLKPVNFSKDLESYANEFVQGTREWVLEAVSDWAGKHDESPFMWLYGGAGTGKSLISYALTQFLPNDKFIVAYFFCRHNDDIKNDPIAIVSTLIWNLCGIFPAFKQHVESQMINDLESASKSILSDPIAAFKSLLIDGVSKLDDSKETILFVIDALDEINPKTRHTSALHVAIRSKSLETVKVLLENGADDYAMDSFGRPPVAYASGNIYEYLKMMKRNEKLIELSKTMTPLQLAVWKQDVSLVKELFHQTPDPLSKNGRQAATILHYAAEFYNSEIFTFLFSQEVCQKTINTADSDRTKKTPLHYASQNGHCGAIETLLKHGAFVDATNLDKTTPLHLAARNGDTKVVALLLANGSNPNAATLNQSRALHFASQNGHVETMEALISAGALVNTVTNTNLSPLHLAAQNGLMNAVKVLICRGANVSIAAKDSEFTPLDLAAQNGHTDVVRFLFDNGGFGSDDNYAALAKASQYGHLETVKLFVSGGFVNINARTQMGDITALHLAAQNGHAEIARYLIEQKIEVNAIVAMQQEFSALHIACWHGHLEVIRVLLDAGARLDMVVKPGRIGDFGGWNPLLLAAHFGRTKAFELLLENGAQIGVIDERNRTVLHIASNAGHKEIMELILEKGVVDVNSLDADYKTALHYAAENGHSSCVAKLIENRADVNSTTSTDGWTALLFAVKRSDLDSTRILCENGANVQAVPTNTQKSVLHLAVGAEGTQQEKANYIKLLINFGALVNAVDMDGVSPLHMACKLNIPYVARILLENGADVNIVDLEGNDALSLSASLRSEGLVELLLQQKVVPDFKSLRDNAEFVREILLRLESAAEADTEGGSFDMWKDGIETEE
ncbi:hypothetical protein HDU99_007163 [Rhizoclosmatium hyalinum]|nr:hypothetical protein HDU99_007163 [Rhizoclosmatium hyalinum]